MAQLALSDPSSPRAPRDKAVRILARTLYRDLQTRGYEAREIVSLSTELLALVTAELRAGDEEQAEQPSP
jgi:hypothetical protein